MSDRKKPATYLYISDPHGAGNRFDALLRCGLNMDGEEALTSDNIATACQKEGIDTVYLLGDLLDRAPDPIATFRTAQTIMASGKGRYVTGNHDFWAMMNMLGIHIPDDGRNKPYWARIVAAHIEHTKRQQKDVYAAIYDKRLKDFEDNYGTELRKLDEKTGTMKDGGGKDLLNYPEEFKATKNTAINNDEALRRFWADLLGRNVEIVVYTGLRDVESMSLGWFEAKREEALALADRYPDDALLQKMPGQLDEIIRSYGKSLDTQVEKYGEDYLTIDQMMADHYATPEWWAYDWIRHKGWGSADSGGLLSVLNDQLPEGARKLDYRNYYENETIREFGKFYKENFSLYERDTYGNALLHSMLPVDDRGIVSIGKVDEDTGRIVTHDENGDRIEGFYYKNTHYADQAIFNGFDRIARDIRDFDERTQSTSEIREALTLINSIYADETTIIKPKMIARNLIASGRSVAEGKDETAKELMARGLGMAMDRLKIPMIICGHNTVDKLEANSMGVINRDVNGLVRWINIDGGMSPKFKGRGMIAKMSMANGFGLRVYGFSGHDTDIQMQIQVPVSELFTNDKNDGYSSSE
ncbi:MAG: metallophosphoesterase [Coriobacteriia bacterium]|nr:metallophosphoesterase [Coriobacteriia bacterium]